MCGGFSLSGLVDVGKGLVGAETSSEKAARTAVEREKRAAKEKEIKDKKALVAQQESVATGQQNAMDANAILQALSQSNITGASQTMAESNLTKRKLIGG